MLSWSLVKITGDSMDPLLMAGDFALFRRLWFRSYRKKDVVLVAHPQFGRIVKEIAEITPLGVELRGINPTSTSRERLGIVSMDRVQGCLVFFRRLAPMRD